jgi:hypothetical protein
MTTKPIHPPRSSYSMCGVRLSTPSLWATYERTSTKGVNTFCIHALKGSGCSSCIRRLDALLRVKLSSHKRTIYIPTGAFIGACRRPSSIRSLSGRMIDAGFCCTLIMAHVSQVRICILFSSRLLLLGVSFLWSTWMSTCLLKRTIFTSYSAMNRSCFVLAVTALLLDLAFSRRLATCC